MNSSIPEEHDGHTIAASFGILQGCLESLEKIAPVESPQQIIELLSVDEPASRRLILIEMIKSDMVCSAELGKPRRLDFYWPALEPELPQASIPLGLVLEEVRLRRAAGDELLWDEYLNRFPNLADTIGKWMQGHTAAATLSHDALP